MARNEFLLTGGDFGQRFNTRGADLDSFAVKVSPLKIHIFAVAVDGIIITAQEFAFVGHHRFFAASWTARSHFSSKVQIDISKII